MVPVSEETKGPGMDGENSECLHSTVEAGEPSRGTRGREGGHRVTEPVEGNGSRSRGSMTPYTGLDWVAEMARRYPDEAITTLWKQITVDLLRESFRKTRKDGAVGVDRQTWRDYLQNLEENLKDLRERSLSGKYKAPPVRRAYIPKAGGKKRPIGIPTLEDKVLQRAVVMILERIYEQKFLDCSYGFRPGRGAHQALEAVRNAVMDYHGGVVIELDIKSFFDQLDHGHLRKFLDIRVRDGVIRRAIDKWLKAGVVEDGQLRRSSAGTPQGGVISPLLANIYLHYVLDQWFEAEVKPRLTGPCTLVRYADDVVIVASLATDARRVMEVLPKRFGRFGLELHPDKTRTISFNKPTRGNTKGGGGKSGPGAFTFLGMTHHWGKSRNGNWVVKQKTASSAFRRVVAYIGGWLMKVRHYKVREQHRQLTWKLQGHDAYYGVTGNYRAISRIRQYVRRCWFKALLRRNRTRVLTWERFNLMLKTYPMPRPKIKHVYSSAARP